MISSHLKMKNLYSLGNIEVSFGKERADNYELIYKEISSCNPDRIICALGRTSGNGVNNIDYLEQPGKLHENLRDNLHAPLNIAEVCFQLNIHLTYIGTGCIFDSESTPDYKFTETDKPNFFGSQYSVVKGITDQLITKYNCANIRIRMPISSKHHDRNFITKLIKYTNIIDKQNSVTYLPEFLPIIIDLSYNKFCGTINCVNTGSISPLEIVQRYKELIDKDHTYNQTTEKQLLEHNIIVSKRSNNTLSTNLIEKLYSVSNIRYIIDSILLSLGKIN